MERLTIKHGNGLYTEVNPVDIVKNEYSINNYNQLLCRLGEYEDLEEQGLLLKLDIGKAKLFRKENGLKNW